LTSFSPALRLTAISPRTLPESSGSMSLKSNFNMIAKIPATLWRLFDEVVRERMIV
jgi:hypothetical protein